MKKIPSQQVKNKTIPPITTPIMDAKRLFTTWRNFIMALNKTARDKLYTAIENGTIQKPAVMDEIFSLIDKKGNKLINLVFPTIVKLMKEIDDRNQRVLENKLKSKFGVNLNNILKQTGLRDAFKYQVDQNLNLIKRLKNDQLARLKNSVLSSLTDGNFSASDLKDKLVNDFGISERHAKFIAVDQAHKVSATLNRVRYQQLGVTKYIWRTMRDTHVRGNPAGPYSNAKYSHYAREGVVFSYKRPPADGAPGCPPGCRCYEEPIFDHLMKKYAGEN